MNEERIFSISTVQTMRQDLLRCKQEKQHYKSLYSQELRNVKLLQKEMAKKIKEISDLKKKIEKKNNTERTAEDIFIKRKRKQPLDMCSVHFKKQKTSDYKGFFQKAIDNLPMCSTSTVTIQCPQHSMNMTLTKSNEAVDGNVHVAAQSTRTPQGKTREKMKIMNSAMHPSM